MTEIVGTITEDYHVTLDIPRLLGERLREIGAGKRVSLDVKEWFRPRTIEQNRLQRLWCKEAAEQLKDMAAEEYRGYCKLHFGVPILCEDPEFSEKYHAVFDSLTYEQRLLAMREPFDFPVTRLMNTKQKKRYLDEMYVHLTGLGAKLTEPKKR